MIPSVTAESSTSDRDRILFVTGRLAAPALENVVRPLAQKHGFVATIHVAKISVAALMTVEWLARSLTIDQSFRRVILPGGCRGDLDILRRATSFPSIERGPDDLADLPRFFLEPEEKDGDYGDFDIEILSEINNANRRTIDELVSTANRLRGDGADIIDLGGTPAESWPNVGEAVRRLRDSGLRVSIDSFDPKETADAVLAGAELVLSVNSTNVRSAVDWGAEVVVIPDDPASPDWLDQIRTTTEQLRSARVPFRIDPVLAPIGFGFAASLNRYLQLREAIPDAEILMGIGNLTELTEVDSAGMNALLIGFCQELGIRSVLTTEVINWARSSTREIDVARRLMYFAVGRRRLPKHRDDRLVQLRDERVVERGLSELHRLHAAIKDPNFRLFAEGGRIHAMNNSLFLSDEDAFRLFERLNVDDPSHAFYLGWEMMKATLALTLGKTYTQDRTLRWGLLTREENQHRLRDRTPGVGPGKDDHVTEPDSP